MQKLSELNPSEVWAYFNEILAIPRISKKEDQIIAYLIRFAEKHKLEYKQDQVGNLLISKPATIGLENRKGMILQSHADMVGEKHAEIKHDFTRDPPCALVRINVEKYILVQRFQEVLELTMTQPNSTLP